MKKSLLVAFLVAAFALSLGACGAKSTSDKGVNCKPGSTEPVCQGG